MTILSAASLLVLCFLGSVFLLVMLMALVAWITDENDPPSAKGVEVPFQSEFPPCPNSRGQRLTKPVPSGVFVNIYYYRETGRRKYVEHVKGAYFNSAFELFDVVLDVCLRKRKRARVKDWKVAFSPTFGRKFGSTAICVNASEEEIDEFCGACWEELNKRLSK